MTTTLPFAPTATPIASGFYGFPTSAERASAMEFAKKIATGGVEVSTVDYRDVQAEFAAQIIFWLKGQRGGFQLNERAEFVSSISGEVVASLVRF